jgi:hypothetical protein
LDVVVCNNNEACHVTKKSSYCYRYPAFCGINCVTAWFQSFPYCIYILVGNFHCLYDWANNILDTSSTVLCSITTYEPM